MRNNQHIHLLSESVTNKIAAGEVVERPASVLKELMENCVDAGADQIDVEVTGGGRRSILVSDNGSGMSADDALMSIQRYATSKIKDVDDIECIKTMGFRGEALAAISSVSRFRLVSRTADTESGTEIVVSQGKVQSVESVGAPIGTSIQVRNLFFNVPARRKFMRTEKTEFSHIRQKFLVYALAYPEIGMTLRADERSVYTLSSGDSMENRLLEIYGDSLRGALRQMQFESNGIRVNGYVALPQVARSDRSDQYVFVNHRPAIAPVIAYAIREGFRTMMSRDRHPVLFLFIEMDPAMVDVNVHPTKREVRFRRSQQLRDAIIGAIRTALQASSDPTDYVAGEGVSREQSFSFENRGGIKIDDMQPTRVFSYPRMPMLDEGSNRGAELRQEERNVGDGDEQSDNMPWSQCRVLGQVGGLFVVLETEDGIVLMDPHAAHERVMFEKFMGQVLSGKVQSQGLLAPETIDMSPENALIVRKNEQILGEMGFGVSSFGGDSFIVDAVPSCLGKVSIAEVVENLAKAAERGGKTSSAEHANEERIAMAACKAAVKAGDILNLDEIERLVMDLAGSRMPYTCPHGRPTIIFMSFKELQKKFGRLT